MLTGTGFCTKANEANEHFFRVCLADAWPPQCESDNHTYCCDNHKNTY
jgi:hypothetical protein